MLNKGLSDGGGTLCSGGRGATFHVGAIRDGLSGKVTFEQSPEAGGGALWISGGRASSRGYSQHQSLRSVCLSRKETEEVGVQCLGEMAAGSRGQAGTRVQVLCALFHSEEMGNRGGF